MIPEPNRISQYLQETLGVTVLPTQWPEEGRLPLFLRREYSFYKADILELPCLLMVDRGEGNSAAAIRKHMDQVGLKWDGEIIYVRGQVASHRRKRLIEQKVPFIVPGNQIYLPMLGVDLREYFRQLRRVSPTLSPATQLVLLNVLLRSGDRIYTPADLAEQLGYSKMTMTRAFNELEAEDLADISMRGRQRGLNIKGDRLDGWQKALPLLLSPVKRRRHVRLTAGNRIGPIAGLSALARHSMLAAPSTATIATSLERWKAIQQKDDFAEVGADDPESLEVEIWSYDPELLSEGEVVDRLSLFLSLRDNEDERVEATLQEMMEAMSW
jgi:hypothetical protein